MKQTQFDKHTIAWFKIDECVSRGEKERALGVYRLLSHSFNDNAIARQLEGDIYLSFGEQELAIPLYLQAIELYQKSQRFLEAAAVCEHLIAMQSHDISLRREAIKLYNMLGNTAKMQAHTEKIIESILATGHDHVLQEFLAAISVLSDDLHEYAVEYIKR
jgi:tetratricopeptide (TPR) repeat protein